MDEITDAVALEEAAHVEAIEGQPESEQPAEVTAEPVEDSKEAEAKKTESQHRRERREAQIKRLVEEKETEAARSRELQARIERLEKSQSLHVEPQEKDFTDYNEYAAAKGAWRYATSAAQRETSEVQQEAQQHTAKAELLEKARFAELRAAYIEKLEEKASVYQDLQQVVTFAGTIVRPEIGEMILEMDQPVDVAYHLGKNPELARQISNMPPHRAAYELGKIEARVSLPQPKLKSDAPDPIRPVNPSGAAVRNIDSMSLNEYRAFVAKGGRIKLKD